MADEPTMYQCTACGKVIQSNGWIGHARSNAHLEAGGDADSFVIFGADDETVASLAPILGVDESELRDILAENADLREKILTLEKDKARMDPLAQWPVWENVEQVRAWLGDDMVRLIGEVELATDNKARQKSGMPPLYSSDPAEYERQLKRKTDESIVKMVAEQTRWTSGVAEGKHTRMRTFKMVFPARNCTEHDVAEKVCYRHGTMRQIPVESQINNGAASLNDPIERYKRKGAKPAAPVRCKLVDCYAPAAVGADGAWAFGMYCSSLHHDYVEGARQMSRAGNEMTVYQPTQVA
jgi:hypothetical protein